MDHFDHIEQLKPKAYLTHIAPDMGLHSETEKNAQNQLVLHITVWK